MPVNVQTVHGSFVIKLIFVVLCFVSSLAHAETIPATTGGTYTKQFTSVSFYGWTPASTLSEACDSHTTSTTVYSIEVISNTNYCKSTRVSDGVTGYNAATYNGMTCNPGDPATQYLLGTVTCNRVTASCPSGQNWTLSGSNCTRPDCIAPQTRDPTDGVCKTLDPCAGKETQPPVVDWYPSAVGQPSLESALYCDAGCTAGLNAAPSGTQYANKTTRWQKYSKVQMGYACAPGLATAPAAGQPDKSPPDPPKQPVCPAGDGVLTSSSGAVHCVPSGTPGSAPPIVQKQQETQNFPDGSKKIIETITTRDPQTGAEVKNQNITNTPATGGGAGEAGTPGTTSKKTDSSANDGGDPTKPGDSDFCAKNPGLQICKGGIAEEKTQVDIKDLQKETKDLTKEIKDILDPDEDVNKDTIEAQKTAYEEKAASHKEFIDSFAARAQNDEGFLSWAMLPEVPAGSCVPFTGTIGGKMITLDWCEQLAMVRDIAGYMFYILTAFGLFRIFSNSTGATS